MKKQILFGFVAFFALCNAKATNLQPPTELNFDPTISETQKTQEIEISGNAVVVDFARGWRITCKPHSTWCVKITVMPNGKVDILCDDGHHWVLGAGSPVPPVVPSGDDTTIDIQASQVEP